MTTKGFLASLFDISFRSLVTPRVIKVLYVLYMIVIALVALAFIISAFHSSTAAGVAVLLIAAPLGFLFYLIVARVWLELVIVLFRIMDNTHQLVEQGTRTSAAPGRPGPGTPPPNPPQAPAS